MDINKITLLEELMDCVGNQGTNAEHSLERVGTRTQMGHGTQVFHGVALFLKRIVRRGGALDLYRLCLDLKGLLCLRRCNQRSGYDESSTNVAPGHSRKIFHGIVINNLERLKIGSVA